MQKYQDCLLTRLKMSKIEEAKSPITTSELDSQEDLNAERFKILTHVGGRIAAGFKDDTNRPTDSFLELMVWAQKIAMGYHNDPANGGYNRFIHNKIIIDGQFMQFCEERAIRIVPIYKDSLVSWRSEQGNEKFFMQGIFAIHQGDNFFIHCSLFHKGNQNEDEISFFILVDNKNYPAYIKLRNEYDEWALKRDRSNLQIRVIDGEDIPYERDMKWDDIYLPLELKENIRLSIEGFLKSKSIYESRKIPWKRGILFYGQPGNGKTSLIKTIISNYDFKPVTVLPSANDDSMRDAFSYAQEQNPALLYFEDLDSLLQNINISLFLNLLDGISTKNGLLIIATANNLDSLKSNLKDRPSRFDRKFEIPLPNEAMSLKYLKKWFGNLINEKEAKKLADFVSQHNFSYAYIKELYISSIYNAIADDRESPTSADIDKALSQLMDDKFRKGSKAIGIDKYIDKNSSKKK